MIHRKIRMLQIQWNSLNHKQDENELKAAGYKIIQDESELEVK